jgi:hypothetical protein
LTDTDTYIDLCMQNLTYVDRKYAEVRHTKLSEVARLDSYDVLCGYRSRVSEVLSSTSLVDTPYKLSKMSNSEVVSI